MENNTRNINALFASFTAADKNGQNFSLLVETRLGLTRIAIENFEQMNARTQATIAEKDIWAKCKTRFHILYRVSDDDDKKCTLISLEYADNTTPSNSMVEILLSEKEYEDAAHLAFMHKFG